MTSHRSIRTRTVYSTQELADLLDVHFRTVQDWHRRGMRAIEENARPLLYMGAEVKRFLESMQRTCGKLGADDFLCCRCQKARKSTPEGFIREPMGEWSGKSELQLVLRGVCSVCGANLIKFGPFARMNDHGQTADVQDTEGKAGTATKTLTYATTGGNYEYCL